MGFIKLFTDRHHSITHSMGFNRFSILYLLNNAIRKGSNKALTFFVDPHLRLIFDYFTTNMDIKVRYFKAFFMVLTLRDNRPIMGITIESKLTSGKPHSEQLLPLKRSLNTTKWIITLSL